MKNTMQTAKHESNTLPNDDFDFFDCRYYIVNKRILSITGQWPFQPKIEKTLRILVLSSLGLTLLIPQALEATNSWGDISLFVECMSPALTHIGCFLKMFFGVYNTSTLREILEEIRFNWKSSSQMSETRILQEYGEKGRRFTIYYMTMIYTVVSAWVLLPMLPKFMDLVAPLNQTRPGIIVVPTDYKIDPDKYFYQIYVHASCICCSSILMLVGIDTLYMAMAQHACGMFEILRCRLENLIQEDAKLNNDIFYLDLRDDICYRQIIPCIKIHRRIIRYVRLMESSNEWVLVVILFFSLLVISCTGSVAVAADTATQDAVRFIALTLAQIVHLFCNTLPGHWIMEASSQVRESSYSARWYMMSRRSRGLILFLLRRTAKPCTIAAGGFYVMSLANFCSVLRTSMSYFTLLTSVQ